MNLLSSSWGSGMGCFAFGLMVLCLILAWRPCNLAFSWLESESASLDTASPIFSTFFHSLVKYYHAYTRIFSSLCNRFRWKTTNCHRNPPPIEVWIELKRKLNDYRLRVGSTLLSDWNFNSTRFIFFPKTWYILIQLQKLTTLHIQLYNNDRKE